MAHTDVSDSCGDGLRPPNGEARFSWTTSVTWGTSVKDDSRALLPHAAVIDATDAEAAAQAGVAVRSGGTYNAVLLFVTADEHARNRIRARAPVPTFVTEKEYMGRLWELPAARQHQG